jgi:hypothetical protein
MLKKIAWILLPLWLISLPGCALCIAGGVGAAAGYHLHGDGYRVRNPITKGGSHSRSRSSHAEKY